MSKATHTNGKWTLYNATLNTTTVFRTRTAAEREQTTLERRGYDVELLEPYRTNL